MTGDADAPALVFLQMAGGSTARTIALVEESQKHGPAFLIDYPNWRWCLDHRGFETLAAEMSRRICEAVPSGPLAVAGLSLGGALAPLIAFDLIASGRQLVWVAAVDPVRFRTSTLQAGWWARAQRHSYQAGRGGPVELASFVGMRMVRITARMLASQLPKGGPALRTLVSAIAPGESLLSREVRMRLLIEAGARWVDTGELGVIDTLCTIFHTVGTPPELEFWGSHFPKIETLEVAGRHETVLRYDVVDLFATRWKQIVTSTIVAPQENWEAVARS